MSEEKPVSAEVNAQAQVLAHEWTKAALDSHYFKSIDAIESRLSLWEASLAGMAQNIDLISDELDSLHDHLQQLDRNVGAISEKAGIPHTPICDASEED